jgi:chemotaxis family two-component system sensor kinase Cph1
MSQSGAFNAELRNFAPPTTVDLMRCEDEPIHIPGAIQSHGCLFEVSGEGRILRASSNARLLLGMAAHDLLEKPVQNALGAKPAAWLAQTLPGLPPASLRSARFVLDSGDAGTVIAHRYDDHDIVEWLPDAEHRVPAPDAMERALSGAMARARSATEMDAALQHIAEGVAAATGIDRVMVYRFHPDWHGEVVAESVQPDLPPYRGLHYPASDIPAQARRLYLASRARVIADVYSRDAILLDADPIVGEPQLDLSHSVLRSVSPVHIQYLRNMGTGATLVTSLVAEGELWGLISCHHRSRHPLPWYAHERMHRFTEEAAAVIAEHRVRERQARERRYAQARSRIVDSLSEPTQAIVDLLLQSLDASGALLCNGSRLQAFGQVPEGARALVDSVLSQDEDLGATAHLTRRFDSAPALAEAAGAAWLLLSRARRELLLVLRPEFAHTVNWGGDPSKPALPDPVSRRLTPRGSFELWQQTVNGQSRPWETEALQHLAFLRDQSVASELIRRAFDGR